MASLDPRDVALNKYLANYALAYRPEGLVGNRLFPVQAVKNQTGTAAVFDRAQWMRPASTVHNPGEQPKTSLVNITTTSFYCQGYAVGAMATYELEDNSDVAILDRLTEATLDRISIEWEQRCFTRAVAGVGSSMSAPVAFTVQSGNVGTSCPTSYFGIAIEAIRATTGLKPNLVIVPQVTYNVLAYHPDIRANGLGNSFQERLASCLQITPEQLAVPYSRLLSNQEGQPNTFVDIWSSSIIFAHVNASGPSVTTFGTTFRWRGPGQSFGGGPPGTQAWLLRDDEKLGTTVYARFYQDEHVVLPECGFLLSTGV